MQPKLASRAACAVLIVAATSSGCSSSTKSGTPPANTSATSGATGGGATTIAAASTPAPGSTPTAATAAGAGASGLDNCAQTTPDSVAATFVSSIAYAGPDTYNQCIVAGSVTADQIKTIKDKQFSILDEIADTATLTYAFTAPDGSKAAIKVAKQANGKFYVTGVTFS